MNSSPPYSPTKSLSGITLRKSRAKSMINRSPAECPMVSFAVFRLFRSNMMQTVGSTYPALTTVLSYVSLLQFFLNNFPQQIPFHLPIDDSIFERNHSKKAELLAKVYDHAKHKYRFGFRMLTLGWSDGSTFLPVNSILLSTENKKNQKISKDVFSPRCWRYVFNLHLQQK